MYADKGHATKHMIKNGKEVGRDLKPLESQRNARDATWVDLLDSANPRWLKTQSTHSTFLKFITLLPSLVVQEFWLVMIYGFSSHLIMIEQEGVFLKAGIRPKVHTSIIVAGCMT